MYVTCNVMKATALSESDGLLIESKKANIR